MFPLKHLGGFVFNQKFRKFRNEVKWFETFLENYALRKAEKLLNSNSKSEHFIREIRKFWD